MSRKPSAETELRWAKSDLKSLRKDHGALAAKCEHYRIRATKAEQELAEWRQRFDLLLTNRLATTSVSACNCSQHRPGETTGGWFCPAHGQEPA